MRPPPEPRWTYPDGNSRQFPAMDKHKEWRERDVMDFKRLQKMHLHIVMHWASLKERGDLENRIAEYEQAVSDFDETHQPWVKDGA